MATSMDSTKPMTVKIADTTVACSNIVVSNDRHAITVSMEIKNIDKSSLLLSINNFCLQQESYESYAQHCYISDGQSFEVMSGWKSFLKDKNYTLIMKYDVSPNLPSYHLCYKTTSETYLITCLKS